MQSESVAICKATECYRGGINTKDNKCDRAVSICPPCLTGSAGKAACFDATPLGECSFGFDCGTLLPSI